LPGLEVVRVVGFVVQVSLSALPKGRGNFAHLLDQLVTERKELKNIVQQLVKEKIVAFVVAAEKKTLRLAETADHVAEDTFVADAVGRLVHIFEQENFVAFALDMFEVAFAEIAAQLVGGPLGAGRPEMGLEEILVGVRWVRGSAYHLDTERKQHRMVVVVEPAEP